DVGEQPARDQRAALAADVGVEHGAGGGLVVEGREPQTLGAVDVTGLDQQAREDGDAGTDRQAAGGPRDRVSEQVALDGELHSRPPRRVGWWVSPGDRGGRARTRAPA